VEVEVEVERRGDRRKLWRSTAARVAQGWRRSGATGKSGAKTPGTPLPRVRR